MSVTPPKDGGRGGDWAGEISVSSKSHNLQFLQFLLYTVRRKEENGLRNPYRNLNEIVLS